VENPATPFSDLLFSLSPFFFFLFVTPGRVAALHLRWRTSRRRLPFFFCTVSLYQLPVFPMNSMSDGNDSPLVRATSLSFARRVSLWGPPFSHLRCRHALRRPGSSVSLSTQTGPLFRVDLRLRFFCRRHGRGPHAAPSLSSFLPP